MDGAREAFGTGSIHFEGDDPRIHLHSALGHHDGTMTACIREHTKVYLVLEVMLLELMDLHASRPWFEKGGFNQLTFSS